MMSSISIGTPIYTISIKRAKEYLIDKTKGRSSYWSFPQVAKTYKSDYSFKDTKTLSLIISSE